MKRFVMLIALMASVAHAQEDNGSYGDPDIRAAREIPTSSPLSLNARASAILVASGYIKPVAGGMVRIGVGTTSLCSGVGGVTAREGRIGLPTCSAVLITPKRVMTAAHCLNVRPWRDDAGNIDESRFRFLFGYDTPFSVVGGFTSVMAERVGKVAKTIHCKRSKDTDIAVVELERAPAGIVPVTRRHRPAVNEPVHLISHPQGMPVKLSTCVGAGASCVQAAIRELDSNRHWFRAPLDSFRGSSGGQVVDDGGNLLGIFSGGVDHLTSSGYCRINVVYPNECKGDLAFMIDDLPAKLFDDAQAMPDIPCEFGEKPDYSPKCPAVNDDLRLAEEPGSASR